MNALRQPSFRSAFCKCGLRYSLLSLSLLLSAWGCSTATPPQSQKTVTILGVIEGEQQERLEQALVPFETETGIDVIYEGNADFATVLKERVSAADAPDLAMFPQPGLMAEFARNGDLVPLSTFIEKSELKAAYNDTWIDLATVEEEAYVIWYRTSVKSLVWYKPVVFERNAYEIPTTWSELTTLTTKIATEGKTPWCIGLESGEATGWPGTDWIEDIMLRTAGPEAYSQWIDHRLPFNSPQVLTAFQKFGEILRNPKYVDGGASSTVELAFSEAPDGLFVEPPRCYMHKQASFIESFFEAGKEPRSDYDVFTLPPIDGKFGTPILVSGDAFGAFRDTPETRALMSYFATPTPHEIWAQLGGFISPHKQVSPDIYPNAVSQKISLILANADVIRFDGSDLMPPEVGTESFWEGIVDFAQGESAEEVAKEIDASWPK